MTPRARAVLVTGFVPHPAGGGPRMRAWEWLLELAEDHDVDLVLLDTGDPTDLDPARGVAASVTTVATTSAGRLGRRLARAVPVLAWVAPRLTAGWHRPGDLPRELVLRVERAELVVTFRLHAHLVGRVLGGPGARRELDLDDRESTTWRSLATSQWRLGRRRETLVSLLTAMQYSGVQRRVAGAYARIHVASSTDVPRHSRRDVRARPNRVRLAELPVLDPADWAARPRQLLFVGTLNYPPNEEAARWLAGPLRDELDRRAMTWEVVVAGLAPTAALAATLGARSGVRLLADVADLGAVYRGARVAVLPLRSGGGTKIKTLEAIAQGLPVVGLPEAFRGLPLRDDEHVSVATSVAEFADRLAELDRMDAGAVMERCRRARARLSPTWLVGQEPDGGAR